MSATVRLSRREAAAFGKPAPMRRTKTRMISWVRTDVEEKPLRWTVWVPIRVVSESNRKGHGILAYKRAQEQRAGLKIAFNQIVIRPAVPCRIRLVRLYRPQDHSIDKDDNLPASFKAIKDWIADYLIPGKPPGIADGSPLLAWDYDQETKPHVGVRIEIRSIDLTKPKKRFRLGDTIDYSCLCAKKLPSGSRHIYCNRCDQPIAIVEPPTAQRLWLETDSFEVGFGVPRLERWYENRFIPRSVYLELTAAFEAHRCRGATHV